MASASDANSATTVLTPGYDPVGHQERVALRVVNITTDATVTPNVTYGDLAIVNTPAGNATQNVNVIQIAGTNTSVNNGTTDAGTQRVTLSSDSTGQVKLATGSQVGASSATGSAIPANAFFIGVSDGTNLRGLVEAITAGNTNGVGLLGAGVLGYDGANFQNIRTAAAGDGINSALATALYNYNGTNNDRVRTPTTFKTATATAAGDTALWTPAAGKKFRLMRFTIQITSDASTTGGADIDIILRDATTGLAAALTVFVPAVAATTFGSTVTTGWINLGNGILSAAANNVLNINLSAALTSGKVRAIVGGTEE
jgi:hypothetical protein